MRANELAAALEILAPGHGWTAVCAWCLAKADPLEERPARRSPDGGDCMRCEYTGRDVFIAALPLDTAKRKA